MSRGLGDVYKRQSRAIPSLRAANGRTTFRGHPHPFHPARNAIFRPAKPVPSAGHGHSPTHAAKRPPATNTMIFFSYSLLKPFTDNRTRPIFPAPKIVIFALRSPVRAKRCRIRTRRSPLCHPQERDATDVPIPIFHGTGHPSFRRKDMFPHRTPATHPLQREAPCADRRSRVRRISPSRNTTEAGDSLAESPTSVSFDKTPCSTAVRKAA